MYKIIETRNLSFVFFHSVLAILFACSFLIIQKIETMNMLNNGFVSNEAIIFIMNQKEINLQKVDGDYLLFQYDKSRSENNKYIRIKGEINLPPIAYRDSENTVLGKNSTIIGEKVPTKSIAKSYSIIGEFLVPNSYKFFNEVWITTTNDIYSGEKGQYFIFQSPHEKTRESFKAFLKTQSVKIISPPVEGTYASKGNQFLLILLKIISIFLFITLTILVTIRIILEKEKLHILYLWGASLIKLFFQTFIWIWFVQVLSLSLCLAIVYYWSEKYLNLWSNEWLLKVYYSSGIVILYTMIVSIIFFYVFTVKRGGKKT